MPESLTSNPTGMEVQRICTAYESGYGRAMSGRSLAQPYADGCPEAVAYFIGYSVAERKVRGKTFAVETKARHYMVTGRFIPLSENGVMQIGLDVYPESTHEVVMVDSPEKTAAALDEVVKASEAVGGDDLPHQSEEVKHE